MLIDSHCHLNFIDLTEFDNNLDNVIRQAKDNDVQHFLCVCVDLSDYDTLCTIAKRYNQVSISVGLHPNSLIEKEPDAALLIQMASHPACIAIGETGLDYYRNETADGPELQRSRFREHIRAAIQSNKPLIIHTRQAAEDTLRVMKEENADAIGGVMHCFSETWDIAKQALDMNFYISMSGIVSFKNAAVLHDVAKKVPLDRLLIETDSPYLAPVPFRGKQNHPALVKYVAQAVADLRQMDYEEVARITTENFKCCFKL
ncbi:deoxyribonuclease belonging to the TatD DNAse family protein [Legionella quinlivanii]|uniref:Deoxyribonuclease belonging to the TatD DNAse family protein n=1 Tax=Legionella quinlivanii TaxID=45073 RepID=A0A0W0Y372_9GAMM|nr:TatD family hydrolase [Legionella quinlivanii]KTD51489.1 deoxyribonuclease belonging to the TatD DNAse family protein [Legionella quinlivanii]MCW8450826.1 TatD family hydrolase [Legionella quinlivanii]SEF56835.1 TatD DNase family protein [Legionella quinlivanii DSM 21216]STY10985.1 deoxyribonuclease belonging to the TatD DNAse family [Legionella quinlivanii]